MIDKNIFLKRQCGECGERQLAIVNGKNTFTTPWRDFPLVFVTVDFEVLQCQNCGNFITHDADSVDRAIEASLCSQTRQFIDIIKSKTHLKSKDIAALIGISPTYLSSLHSGARYPSFQIWNFLKVTALDPVEMCRKLNPELDVVNVDLLLHA